MTDMKQPEALRLAQFCRAIARGLLIKPYIEDLNAAAALLAHQYTEIEALQDDLVYKDDYAEQLGRELAKADPVIKELRARLDELEKQEPVAFVNEQGFIVERDDMQISSGEKLYLAAGTRPVEEVSAGEYPPLPEVYATMHDDGHWTMKAGKEPYESYYAGWRKTVYTADQMWRYVDADRAMRAAQPAPGAGDQVQMILKHRLMRKVAGDWLAASEFMTGEPDPSWLAKTEESPEEWRIEQARRVSGEQIQAGLTRAFASWKKPAPAAQDDAERCVRLRALLLNSFGLDVNESPQEVEQTDALFRDAARYRWLTDDHERPATRIVRNQLCERLPWMSYSAVSADIDAAIAASKKEPT